MTSVRLAVVATSLARTKPDAVTARPKSGEIESIILDAVFPRRLMTNRASLAAVAIKVDAAERSAQKAIALDGVPGGSVHRDDFARSADVKGAVFDRVARAFRVEIDNRRHRPAAERAVFHAHSRNPRRQIKRNAVIRLDLQVLEDNLPRSRRLSAFRVPIAYG